MKNDSVTWIMPVLNGMPYLPETLASIERQTFKDFEVLVWDNGSTDGTLEVLKEWIPSRLPGRVVADSPLSYPRSLSELVLMARTPLLARIDADDVNHPERLARQVAYLAKESRVVVVGSQVRKLTAEGDKDGIYHELPCRHEEMVVRMMRYWALWHPTVLMRREAVIAAGNYQDDYAVDDYNLWLRLARVGLLANLPEALVDYRVHETSVTEREKKGGRLAERMTDCVLRHGPPLFGLDETALRRVRSGGGLTFAEMLALRNRLRENGGRFGFTEAAIVRQEGRGALRSALLKGRSGMGSNASTNQTILD